MSHYSCDPPDDDTDRDRLANAQVYLRKPLERVAPDTVLCHAWDEFCQFYDRLIRRCAHSFGLRADQVEDCVQDVWVYLAVKLQDFQHNGNRHGFRSWLFLVVKSRAIDLLRRHKSRAADGLSQAVEAGREPSDPHAHAEQEHVWERELVETSMEELRKHVSERTFQVVYQIELEQRSSAEVAAALGLTPDQVRFRHWRAMKLLRKITRTFSGEHFDADK